MPICQADAKSLEINCGAYLSQDKIMLDELRSGLDMHTLNQESFGLPSRLIAKVLIFRIMYGGTGYSFAKDSDFISVSTSAKYWENKIENFYAKYTGFRDWHKYIVQTATRQGYLLMPTGRKYNFELVRNYKQELEAPQTTIKNYPVQGLGADLMAIARVSFKRRWDNAGIVGKCINTVHDSIVVDVPTYEVPRVAQLFHDVFRDLPANFQKMFKVEFNLPLRCEVKVGKNMMDMEEYQIAA